MAIALSSRLVYFGLSYLHMDFRLVEKSCSSALVVQFSDHMKSKNGLAFHVRGAQLISSAFKSEQRLRNCDCGLWQAQVVVDALIL